MTTIAEIQKAVAQEARISVNELISARRKHTRARQLAMFLCRELTPASYPVIGRMFRRDQTTVPHACEVIARAMAAVPGLKNDVEELARRISP